MKITLKMYATLTSGKHGAKASLMEFYDRKVKPKKGGMIGGNFMPTSKKTVGDKAVLVVDGQTTTGSSKSCHKAGEVRIGGRDFDLKRCYKRKYVSHAGQRISTQSFGL